MAIEAAAAVDLAVLCATICDDAADHGHDARYRGPAHCEVAVRPGILKRAIVNLVENGLHYGDRVVVTLLDGPEEVVIRVEDDGPGIPDAQLARVLEPFVRLDSARARDTIGLGLGLSIVARAAAEHRGTLTLGNRPAGGLRADLALPKQLGNIS
jgi:signal transduction histidine kinase